jgi:Tol biopolymer transport system component
MNRSKQTIIWPVVLIALMNWGVLKTYSYGQPAVSGSAVQSASGPTVDGRIVFVSVRGDNFEIDTMNPDGSDRIRLTSGPHDLSPAWSPDGTQIVFARTDASIQRSEIFIMNSDGSNQTRLTSGETDGSPAWSPDGTQIVFVRLISESGLRRGQIFAINADGRNPRRLTDSGESDYSPVWSPDGAMIAFTRGNLVSLVVMNADGSNQRAISSSYSPVTWSPDSSKLAFANIFYGYPDGIVVVNADGTSPRPIATPPSFGYEAFPSWSPSGSKITFTRFDDCDEELVNCGSQQVWVVDSDGRNPTKLIDYSAGFEAANWSPDGTRIIFSDGDDILVVNADGSGLANITNTRDAREFAPSWQPRLLGCADSISPTGQTFDADGGTGGVNVKAAGDCSWTATSNASWITVISSPNSGNGSVVFSVAVNTGTAARTGALIVAGRVLRVTQAGIAVRITSASVSGKRLMVFGENFDPGAAILLNGEAQKTISDEQSPKSALIAKKAGKSVNAGDKLQVRNPNGSTSQEFTFAAAE